MNREEIKTKIRSIIAERDTMKLWSPEAIEQECERIDYIPRGFPVVLEVQYMGERGGVYCSKDWVEKAYGGSGRVVHIGYIPTKDDV